MQGLHARQHTRPSVGKAYASASAVPFHLCHSPLCAPSVSCTASCPRMPHRQRQPSWNIPKTLLRGVPGMTVCQGQHVRTPDTLGLCVTTALPPGPHPRRGQPCSGTWHKSCSLYILRCLFRKSFASALSWERRAPARPQQPRWSVALPGIPGRTGGGFTKRTSSRYPCPRDFPQSPARGTLRTC